MRKMYSEEQLKKIIKDGGFATNSEVSEAISQAVAGRLPVYQFELSDDIPEDFFINIQLPCILKLYDGEEFYYLKLVYRLNWIDGTHVQLQCLFIDDEEDTLRIGTFSGSVEDNWEYWTSSFLGTYALQSDIKPLYFHPITLSNDVSGINLSWTMIIIDNNPEPYDTWAKIKTKMFAVSESINGVARFLVNGCYHSSNDTETVICNNFDANNALQTIKLYGVQIETGLNYNKDVTNLSIFNIYDGVNKIN